MLVVFIIIISMGYEQNIPPIPTRDQENAMIEKFEQSWIEQPWNRFYMNENLRVPKMNNTYRKEYARRQWFKNMLYYAVLFAPLLYLSKRFFIYRKGLPLYADFKYNDVVVKAHTARRNKFGMTAVPLYLLGVFTATTITSDDSVTLDNELVEDKDQRWI